MALTIELDSYYRQDVYNAVNAISASDKPFILSLDQQKKRRSLNANAYFHVLVGKIAEAQKPPISKARAKNILLGRYGQRELTDTGPLLISVRSDIDMMEKEDLHCVPVGYGKVKNTEFTHYALVRGSHTYDNREMSILIDGTIEDAKELGVETLSPAEIERMKRLWNSNR